MRPAVHERVDRRVRPGGPYIPVLYGYECLRCRYREERSEFDAPPYHECPACGCEFWVLVGESHDNPFR